MQQCALDTRSLTSSLTLREHASSREPDGARGCWKVIELENRVDVEGEASEGGLLSDLGEAFGDGEAMPNPKRELMREEIPGVVGDGAAYSGDSSLMMQGIYMLVLGMKI